MRIEPRHLVNAGATAGISDQVSEPMRCDARDHLRLCQPHKWVRDINWSLQQLRKYPSESCKSLRMGGPGSSRANNLGHRREVQAHDAVLKELDVIKPEEAGRYGPQCREQEGARPVRRLLAQL